MRIQGVKKRSSEGVEARKSESRIKQRALARLAKSKPIAYKNCLAIERKEEKERQLDSR